eukprot:g1445.t1
MASVYVDQLKRDALSSSKESENSSPKDFQGVNPSKNDDILEILPTSKKPQHGANQSEVTIDPLERAVREKQARLRQLEEKLNLLHRKSENTLSNSSAYSSSSSFRLSQTHPTTTSPSRSSGSQSPRKYGVRSSLRRALTSSSKKLSPTTNTENHSIQKKKNKKRKLKLKEKKRKISANDQALGIRDNGASSIIPDQPRRMTFCICNTPYEQKDDQLTLECVDGRACNGWIHPTCFRMNERKISKGLLGNYTCDQCKKMKIEQDRYEAEVEKERKRKERQRKRKLKQEAEKKREKTELMRRRLLDSESDDLMEVGESDGDEGFDVESADESSDEDWRATSRRRKPKRRKKGKRTTKQKQKQVRGKKKKTRISKRANTNKKDQAATVGRGGAFSDSDDEAFYHNAVSAKKNGKYAVNSKKKKGGNRSKKKMRKRNPWSESESESSSEGEASDISDEFDHSYASGDGEEDPRSMQHDVAGTNGATKILSDNYYIFPPGKRIEKILGRRPISSNMRRERQFVQQICRWLVESKKKDTQTIRKWNNPKFPDFLDITVHKDVIDTVKSLASDVVMQGEAEFFRKVLLQFWKEWKPNANENDNLTADEENKYEWEYLVKWHGLSYLHVGWTDEETVMYDNAPHGKARLKRFISNPVTQKMDAFQLELMQAVSTSSKTTQKLNSPAISGRDWYCLQSFLLSCSKIDILKCKNSLEAISFNETCGTILPFAVPVSIFPPSALNIRPPRMHFFEPQCLVVERILAMKKVNPPPQLNSNNRTETNSNLNEDGDQISKALVDGEQISKALVDSEQTSKALVDSEQTSMNQPDEWEDHALEILDALRTTKQPSSWEKYYINGKVVKPCDWFLTPVSENDAPGYYETINNPMDMGTIRERLEDGFYALQGAMKAATPESLGESVVNLNGTSINDAIRKHSYGAKLFINDMRLVFQNAREWNGSDSWISYHADCVEKKLQKLLLADAPLWNLLIGNIKNALLNEPGSPMRLASTLKKAEFQIKSRENASTPFASSASPFTAYLIKWSTLPHIAATWETERTLRAWNGFKGVENFHHSLQGYVRSTHARRQKSRNLQDFRNGITRKQRELAKYLSTKSVNSSHTSSSTLSRSPQRRTLQSEEDKDEKSEQNSEVTTDKRLSLSSQISGTSSCARYAASPAYRNGYKLRNYQLSGLNWLIFAWFHRRNCILADEMGLGKTIQSIAFFNHLREYERIPFPCLIVAPLSTLAHWYREVETWTNLNPVLYHSAEGGAKGRQFIRMTEWYYFVRQQSQSSNSNGISLNDNDVYLPCEVNKCVSLQKTRRDLERNETNGNVHSMKSNEETRLELPTSVVSNLDQVWTNNSPIEIAERWPDELNIEDKQYLNIVKGIYKFDVLITSYELLATDVNYMERIRWGLVVVDEGQRLKNAKGRLTEALGRLRFGEKQVFSHQHRRRKGEKSYIERRLVLSGTPLQNDMRELWSIMHYIEPLKFASMENFMEQFGDLQTADQVDELQRLLQPHLLRRLKEDVEKSIPLKKETIVDIELTTLQKQYYRALYERNREFLVNRVGHSHSHNTATQRTTAFDYNPNNHGSASENNVPKLINLEMELRKCCNHPFLLTGVEDKEVAYNASWEERFDNLIKASGKLIFLDKLLKKLKSEKTHKVLIFSQMTHMLDILEDYCLGVNWGYERIDGSIKGVDRQSAIDRFSDPENTYDKFIFLLSTRAGGVGINLTAADTVIIFDSDWNPQNDLQAQARAHRIGQTKDVMIYRLITRNTYESIMFQKASMKLGLEQAILGNGSVTTNNLSKKEISKRKREEIENLLKLGAYAQISSSSFAPKNAGSSNETIDDASKWFHESDINTLLAKHSRQVYHDNTPDDQRNSATTSDNAANQSSFKSRFNFSKATFTSEHSNDQISLNDPQFWTKILGQDKRDTLIERTTETYLIQKYCDIHNCSEHELEGDYRSSSSFSIKNEWKIFRRSLLDEIDSLAKVVIEEKLEGIAVPKYSQVIETVLIQLQTISRFAELLFSETQMKWFKDCAKEIRKPKRKRKQVISTYANASFEESTNVEKTKRSSTKTEKQVEVQNKTAIGKNTTKVSKTKRKKSIHTKETKKAKQQAKHKGLSTVKVKESKEVIHGEKPPSSFPDDITSGPEEETGICVEQSETSASKGKQNSKSNGKKTKFPKPGTSKSSLSSESSVTSFISSNLLGNNEITSGPEDDPIMSASTKKMITIPKAGSYSREEENTAAKKMKRIEDRRDGRQTLSSVDSKKHVQKGRTKSRHKAVSLNKNTMMGKHRKSVAKKRGHQKTNKPRFQVGDLVWGFIRAAKLFPGAKQPLLGKTFSKHVIDQPEGHAKTYTSEKVVNKVEVTKEMQPLSDNDVAVNRVLSLPPGAAEFDSLSSSNILMKHKCFSSQYCVFKERSKEFCLRTLQLWGTKVQSSVDTSVDRVLQNVSTWYTTDECIPLHLFIHGIFVVLDGGINSAKVFMTALEATLECHDLVSLTSNHHSLQSKKAVVTHQDVNNNMPLSTLKPSTNRQLNHINVTISHGKNQPRYLTSCSSCPSGKTCIDIVEASNTNACSGSFTKITSETECQDAANRLGYTWKFDLTSSGSPSGCYRLSTSLVYYNKHSTGSAQSNSYPICQGCILECPAGQYLPFTSSSQCHECPKGRYGSTAGLTMCSECPAGRYGSTTGLQSSSCTGACDPGSLEDPGSVNTQCSSSLCPQVPSECQILLTVSTEADLKNAVTVANNGGISSYVQGTYPYHDNIQFSGAMQTDSALYIDSATIAIVGQGEMKELKGQGQSGNYRILAIAESSSKFHLENLKITNGFVSNSIFIVQNMEDANCKYNDLKASGTLSLVRCTITNNEARYGISGGYVGSGTFSLDEFTYFGGNKIRNIVESPCGHGKYRTTQMSCSNCIAGRFQDMVDMGGCKVCDLGTSSKLIAASSCFGCQEGEYQDKTASTFCERCPAGRYGDALNRTSVDDCKQCEAGKWSLSGLTTCYDCPVGKRVTGNIGFDNSDCDGDCGSGRYRDSTSSTCKACEAGRYSSENATGACKSCEAGYVNLNEGQTSCTTKCSAGKYSLTGASFCLNCPAGRSSKQIGLNSSDYCTPVSAGKYANATGNAKDCQAGQYQDEEGQTFCKLCPAGYYNGQHGQSECTTPCPAGKYSLEGASFCQNCPAGRSSNQVGLDSSNACIPVPIGKYANSDGNQTSCPPGQYQDEEGQTFCKLCPAGYFNEQVGQSSCATPCPGGKYSLEGARFCLNCPAGRSSNQIGLNSSDYCTPVPAGKYANAAGNATNCQAGQYQDEEGQTFCKLCPAGYYNDQTTQTSCTNQCPIGTYSTEGSIRCQKCAGGFKGIRAGATSLEDGCEKCPVGKYSNDTGGHRFCTECTILGTYCPAGAIKPELCGVDKYCNGKMMVDRPSKPTDVTITRIGSTNAINVSWRVNKIAENMESFDIYYTTRKDTLLIEMDKIEFNFDRTVRLLSKHERQFNAVIRNLRVGTNYFVRVVRVEMSDESTRTESQASEISDKAEL